MLKPGPLPRDGAGAEPSGARQEMGGDGGRVFDPFGGAQWMRVWIVIIGPINEQWSADEALALCGTPEPAVVAVVAVIAHHEELIGAQHDGAVVVAVIELRRVVMDRIRFVQLPAIDVYV